MRNATSVKAELGEFTGRGFVVTVSPAGTLQVRPASRLTADDRGWLRTHTAAILAHLSDPVPTPEVAVLSGNEPWDATTAFQLSHTAEELVEQLGVSGQHPAVQAAAALVGSALDTRDLETVRFAVS